MLSIIVQRDLKFNFPMLQYLLKLNFPMLQYLLVTLFFVCVHAFCSVYLFFIQKKSVILDI